jgi:hypothetical protein
MAEAVNPKEMNQRLGSDSPVTRAQLATDLTQLGLGTGRTVMVHTYLKSLGRVIGGEQTVLEALRDAVGATGNARDAHAIPRPWAVAAHSLEISVPRPRAAQLAPRWMGSITRGKSGHDRRYCWLVANALVSAVGLDWFSGFL